MTFRIIVFFYSIFLMVGCKSPDANGQLSSVKDGLNHLANESSPYLLQHADNPVDWYPWGKEALEKAKAENKIIIISVGYSACHWCHIMEHESFEDSLVATIMNEHYVSVKVDREERPDIDNVYMTACHLSTRRSCGWPLNAFALPDGRPFYAGTYFTKQEWLDILPRFYKLYLNNPAKVEEIADQITRGIQLSEDVTLNETQQDFTRTDLDSIAQRFIGNIDMDKGGRIGKPKFPLPNNYQFLLSYHQLSKDEKALHAVTTTLNKMAYGGIYDHLGGGFARYSTDEEWKVPHFEKMLYDNSQIISLYANAYKLTKNPLYKKVIEESLAFIKREMTNNEGGFYSSLDADSEGEEGKFYVWKKNEIDQLIQDKMQKVYFNDYYGITSGGNWEHGKNILHRHQNEIEIMDKYNISKEEFRTSIDNSKSILLNARSKRVRPGLDDKVLTSWNALMLKGYVDAYTALGNTEYLETALANASFLVKNMMQEDGRLNRNYKDGKSVINAFLDDYAFLVDAFLTLYQATFDENWLAKAGKLNEYALEHFYDPSIGMFNYTSDLDPPLFSQKKEIADNVIPGSNSAMARNLFHLGLLLYNNDYLEKARQMVHNIADKVVHNPSPNFYSNWCRLYLSLVNEPYEIAIVGKDANEKRKDLTQHYLPNALFLGGETEGSLELLKNKLQEGKTMIYVCQNKVCKLPVSDVDKALELMK